MNFENLYNLSNEEKKDILSNLIKNDVNYWKKILVLMTMIDEEENTELLDLIIENKTKEIELANKVYNFGIYESEINEETGMRDYTNAMKEIVNNNCNNIYAKACSEVLEVLRYIPNNYYKTINKSFIDRLEKMADKSYKIEIKPKMKFLELNLLEETKEILDLIKDKFWKKDDEKVTIYEIFNKMEE